MPIVSHTYSAVAQPDGRQSFTLRLYDQEGNEVGPFLGLLPAGMDPATMIATKIVEADEQLAENEFRALLGL